MVRQRLAIPQEADDRETAAKVADGLHRWIPDADDRDFIAPRIGALLGLSASGLSREELFAGWRLFLERLAAEAPIVLAFEDLQWADEGVLQFIEHLLDWSSQQPIFLLTLARPEMATRPEAGPAPRRGATLLQLEPLEAKAIGALLDG